MPTMATPPRLEDDDVEGIACQKKTTFSEDPALAAATQSTNSGAVDKVKSTGSIRKSALPPKAQKEFAFCATSSNQSEIDISDVLAAVIQKKETESQNKKLKVLLCGMFIMLILCAAVAFSATFFAIQLTKEIRATSGGVLQTQDGETALVGSSDTQVCGQGALCNRNNGLAISTATESVSLSFRKLASAASNLTLITPLLTDATSISHLNVFGETAQTKVRRAWVTPSESGNQVSLSLEVDDDLVHGATLQIGKSKTTYTDSDETYDTSGQVFFQLTPTSAASWHAILAVQGIRRLQAGGDDDDEPLAASDIILDGFHRKAIEITEQCSASVMKAFSKEAMEIPARDSFESESIRERWKSICDLKCQPDNGCIVASGHCTSQAFRALDKTNQTAQLFEGCEHVMHIQASVHSTEDDLNEELDKTNAENNATFAYGGGRRLGEESRRLWSWRRRRRRMTIMQRLSGFGSVGCCSTGAGMLVGNDYASCVDSPHIEYQTSWRSISGCCYSHDYGTRMNTYFNPGRKDMKSSKPSNCDGRGNADSALASCAARAHCHWWDWGCFGYNTILFWFMRGRPNQKSPKGESAC